MLATFSNAITFVWLLLFAGTAVSWLLVPGGGIPVSPAPGIAILSIAFFKVRLILLYFMELRFAPQPWRSIFEIWVILVWASVVYLYLNGEFSLAP